MLLYKSTSFLSEIKTFFKNSDMTEAMQNLSSVPSGVKMAEKTQMLSKAKATVSINYSQYFKRFFYFPALV